MPIQLIEATRFPIMSINAFAHQEILNRAIQRVRRAKDNVWAIFVIQNVEFNVPCKPDDELILSVLKEGIGEEFRPLLTENSACYLYINSASFGERSTRRLSLVYWVGEQLNSDVVSSYAHVFTAFENMIRRRDTVLIASRYRDVNEMLFENSVLYSTDSLERRQSGSISTLGSLPIETQSRTRSLSGLHQTCVNPPPNSRSLKIIIIGNQDTGKTSITHFLCNGTTSDDGPPRVTIGIDVFTKRLFIDNMFVTLHIFDTVGQERFNALPRSYYRNANGVVLVFSYDHIESFQALDNWLSHATQNTLDCRPAFTLIGNKNDIAEGNRDVTQQQVSVFCQQNGISYIDTSAKTGHNINLAFTQLIQMYYSLNVNNIRSPVRNTRAGTDIRQVSLDRQPNDPPDIVVLEQNPQNPPHDGVVVQGNSRQGSVRRQDTWVQKCCEE